MLSALDAHYVKLETSTIRMEVSVLHQPVENDKLLLMTVHAKIAQHSKEGTPRLTHATLQLIRNLNVQEHNMLVMIQPV